MRLRSENLFAAVGLYVVIFAAHFASLRLPNVPTDQGDLDAEQAWLDLHKITRKPHPYNSHENDVVRQYILQRLAPIAAIFDHVHLHDDIHTNVTYFDLSKAVYFEGKNILVKIDGTDTSYRNRGGVLFSAHLDSVSSGVGARDDGMGVVTCMQLVQYFAANRPRRTVVVNINDGEEDGLNGAHAFLGHPWSRMPQTFVNLEGSGAGGPPILFRTTSSKPVHVASSSILHPRANILTSDAFAHRLIRSRTDFSVYDLGGGYEGIDLAFYQRRSRYHTKFDSIPFLNGGIKSLWSMMETTRDVGAALANRSPAHDEETIPEPAVYFDVLGQFLVVFSKHKFFGAQIVAVIGFPIIRLFIRSFQRQPSDGRRTTAQLKIRSRIRKALVLVLLFQWSTAWVLFKVNPFVLYASPYLVLGIHSVITLATFAAAIPQYGGPAADFDNLQAVLQQLYVFSLLLTLGTTILQAKVGVTALYFILGWNICLWLAVVVGALPSPASTRRAGKSKLLKNGAAKENVPTRFRVVSLAQVVFSIAPSLILFSPVVDIIMSGMIQSMADGSNPFLIHIAVSLGAFLISIPIVPWLPPISRRHTTILTLLIAGAFAYACVVFPFSVETPFKVFFEQSVDVTNALDLLPISSSNQSTYEIKSFTELTGVQPFLLRDVVPAIPSTFDIRRRRSGSATTTTTDKGRNDNGGDDDDDDDDDIECINTPDRPGTETCIWNDGLLPRFGPPHAHSHEGKRLTVDRWLEAHIERTGPQSVRFTLRGLHSRNCRIYFDSAKIGDFHVLDGGLLDSDEDEDEDKHGDGMGRMKKMRKMEPTYGFEAPKEGVDMVVLFSREFGREWVVDVQWLEVGSLELEPPVAVGGEEASSRRSLNAGSAARTRTTSTSGGTDTGGRPPSIDTPAVVQGRVACEWSEYASGRRDGGGDGDGEEVVGSEIPAFEEVLEFVPRWVAVSKAHHGLLEVWARFEI